MPPLVVYLKYPPTTNPRHPKPREIHAYFKTLFWDQPRKMCSGLNGVAIRATDAKLVPICVVFRAGSNGPPPGPPNNKSDNTNKFGFLLVCVICMISYDFPMIFYDLLCFHDWEPKGTTSLKSKDTSKQAFLAKFTHTLKLYFGTNLDKSFLA